jgi:hypothetical protein
MVSSSWWLPRNPGSNLIRCGFVAHLASSIRICPGCARGGHGYGVGRGVQGNAGNTGYGGGRNFVHGESSGTAGMGSGHQEENWGGANTFF